MGSVDPEGSVGVIRVYERCHRVGSGAWAVWGRCCSGQEFYAGAWCGLRKMRASAHGVRVAEGMGDRGVCVCVYVYMRCYVGQGSTQRDSKG